MVTREAMVIFYRACGYGELDSITRAGKYINLQTMFYNSRVELEKMTDEDQIKLSEKENE